jgi:hypothetical protein
MTFGPHTLDRREFLWRRGGALGGGIALADLLGRQYLLAAAAPHAPPAPEGAAGADGKQLEEAFRRVFDNDFDVVGHRIAENEHRSRHCLIEAAPRKAGFFTVRYDVSYPPEHRGVMGEGRRATWYVMVAERGRPRRHARGDYGHSTTPLACVGDTITFSVRADSVDLGHRFFREPFNPREAEVMLGSDRELADPPARPEANGLPVAIESEVEEHLRLLNGNAMSGESRGGDFALHYLGGSFEARKPARFNLRSSAGTRLFGGSDATEGLSVQIAPREAPLRVLADRLHRLDFDGKFQSSDVAYHEPGTLVVREGDRVGLSLWTYQTFLKRGGVRKEVRHPKVTIRRLPFKPKPWPFGHQVVAP